MRTCSHPTCFEGEPRQWVIAVSVVFILSCVKYSVLWDKVTSFRSALRYGSFQSSRGKNVLSWGMEIEKGGGREEFQLFLGIALWI